MKVFFGEALEDMVKELRGQAVNNVRLHALSEVEGDEARIDVHVTTLCNNQVFEAVLTSRAKLDGEGPEQKREALKKACENACEKVVEQLPGFEIRKGVLQE